MFLIWYHTHKNPGIILIDEPELHLNPELQINFISKLTQLTPWNQYIVTTHSEHIFDSVQPDRRVLLQSE